MKDVGLDALRWYVALDNIDEKETFSSLERVQALKGEEINRSAMSRLTKVKVKEKYYYVKFYEIRGRGIRRLLGRSRIRAEWENVKFLTALGIPSTRLVAFGEQATIFGDRKGAMVTEEIVGVADLAELAISDSARLNDGSWIREVSRRLSGYVSRMHGCGFVHNDLKWRNILVSYDGSADVYVIDCPQGRISASWFIRPYLNRGIIKDLACLDKVAKYVLSRTQRLRFYFYYASLETLDRKHKKRIRRILGFFAGRE